MHESMLLSNPDLLPKATKKKGARPNGGKSEAPQKSTISDKTYALLRKLKGKRS